MQSLFYRNLESRQKYYDAMLMHLKNKQRDFSADNNIDYSELFEHILNDHPELFYVKQFLKTVRSFFDKKVVFSYIYSPSEEKDITSNLKSITRQILASLLNEHQSEYDKVRILHDYLKANVQYDVSAANNCDLEDKENSESHTIVGALINRKCVCEGFSKAMKFLCDNAGLTCWVVSGEGHSLIESGPHAWNIVKINGYYHHVDVTWDNQYASSAEIPNYEYLNLSDAEISRDHDWNRKNYPACPTAPYNYFHVNNALIDSEKQLENFLLDNFRREEELIAFKVVRGSRLEREIKGALGGIIHRASDRSRYTTVRTFRCNSIPSQLTFCIQVEYILC